MKMPKEWDLTLKDGIITTEMIDACATAAIARTNVWRFNLETAQTMLNKKPNSKIAKSKLRNARCMIEFYSKQAQAVLAYATPRAIYRVWSEPFNDYVHYVEYNAGHTFYIIVSKETAFDIMENYDVDTFTVDEAPSNNLSYTDLVSYYFVNRVIAAANVYGLDYHEGQAFEPNNDTWQPQRVVNTNADEKRELYVECK